MASEIEQNVLRRCELLASLWLELVESTDAVFKDEEERVVMQRVWVPVHL